MKKILAMLIALSVLFCLTACGESSAESTDEGIIHIDATSSTSASMITEEDARACLMLSNEDWWCYPDSVETGTEVSAHVEADYYISEVDDAPYDVKSVEVRYVKFGDNEYIPSQTSNSEMALKMLKDYGYGAEDYLVLDGTPRVVFFFEGEASGIYNEEDMTIDIPLVISCNVVFENGEEVVVDYTDDHIFTGSGGYMCLDESSFENYR